MLEEKEFLKSNSFDKEVVKMSDYFTKLAERLNSKRLDEIDSNLAYEIAYADTYLDNILEDCEDKALHEQYTEVKLLLDNVLDSISEEKLVDFYTGLDYKDLVSSREEKTEVGVFEVASKRRVFKEYAKKLWQRFYPLLFVALMLSSVVFASKHIDEPVMRNGVDITQTVRGLTSICLALGSLVTTFFVCYFCICVSLDFMYLMLPFTREIFNKASVNLVYNKALVECLDKAVVLKPVKETNRIKRNLCWLKIMREDETTDAEIKKECERIYSELGKTTWSKNAYLLVAEIEFLYERYLEGGKK